MAPRVPVGLPEACRKLPRTDAATMQLLEGKGGGPCTTFEGGGVGRCNATCATQRNAVGLNELT